MFGVGSARGPDGPPQSGVAHGFSLIPVSGVGVVVGDEKRGGSGVEGTFNEDMTKDEMTFLDTQRSVKPLSQTCNHMWRAQREKVRVYAYGEVLSRRSQTHWLSCPCRSLLTLDWDSVSLSGTSLPA